MYNQTLTQLNTTQPKMTEFETTLSVLGFNGDKKVLVKPSKQLAAAFQLLADKNVDKPSYNMPDLDAKYIKLSADKRLLQAIKLGKCECIVKVASYDFKKDDGSPMYGAYGSIMGILTPE